MPRGYLRLSRGRALGNRTTGWFAQKTGTVRALRERAWFTATFSSKIKDPEWRLQSRKRRARVRVAGRVTANNLESVNELAVRGHGVALLPEPYLLAGSALGVLERVLPAWTSASIPVQAVYLNRRFVPAKVQAFIAELSSWKNSTWRKHRTR